MEVEFEHPENNWYRVPKWVEDYPVDVLDVYAFRILCHLARRDRGTRSDARELCERFGIAYDGKVWRRCSRQLRALNALEEVTLRATGGRLRTVLRFRWPPKPEASGRATAGEAGAGRSKGTAGEAVDNSATARSKRTIPIVQKERASLETETATRRAAAVAAERRNASRAIGPVVVEDEPKAKIEPAGKTEREPELSRRPEARAAGERWSLPEPTSEAKARVRSLVADFVGCDRREGQIASNEASGRAIAAE